MCYSAEGGGVPAALACGAPVPIGQKEGEGRVSRVREACRPPWLDWVFRESRRVCPPRGLLLLGHHSDRTQGDLAPVSGTLSGPRVVGVRMGQIAAKRREKASHFQCGRRPRSSS